MVEANLRVVCNIGAAGLNTGEEEGFVLDIPGTPFTAGGMFGPFEPFTPVPGGPTMGITVFNLLSEHENLYGGRNHLSDEKKTMRGRWLLVTGRVQQIASSSNEIE